MGATGTILCRLGGGRASPGPGDAPDPGRRPGGRRLGAGHPGGAAQPFRAPCQPGTSSAFLARSPMLSFAALRPIAVPVLWLLWGWMTLSFGLSVGPGGGGTPGQRRRLGGRAAGDDSGAGLPAGAPGRPRSAGDPLHLSGDTERHASGRRARRDDDRRCPGYRRPPAMAAAAPAVCQPTVAPAGAPRQHPASSRARAASVPRMTTARHTVAPGECLSRIAEWYRDDWTAYPHIARDPDNRIANPNLIYPGQVIVIRDAVRTAPMPTVVAPPADGEQTYRVRPGDTLAGVAEAVYADPARAEELYLRNWAAIPNPHRLFWGTTLVLPVIPDAASGPRALAPRPPNAAGRAAPPTDITPTPPVDRWATTRPHRRPPAAQAGYARRP